MRVIDLFCGAGLFSEGFRRAGFEVVLGVDIEPKMLSTFRRNHPETEVWEQDVLTIEPSELPDADVIIGSPPCQQFSYANKNRNPEKGMVFVNWMLDAVRVKKPKFWITENVPPMLKYLPRWIPIRRVLNVADYGVPQTRRRCFAGSYPVPLPTHARVTSSTLTGAELRPWVSVREAIGDLPSPLLTHRRSLDIDRVNEYRVKTGLRLAPDSIDGPSRAILASEGQSTEKGMILIDPNNLNPDSRGPFGIDQPSPRSVIGKMRLEISDETLERIEASGVGLRVHDLDKPAKTIKTITGGPQNAEAYLQCHTLPDYEPERAIKRKMNVPFMRKNPPLKLDEPSRAVKSHLAKAPKELLLPILDAPATTVQGDPRLWPRGHKANRFSRGIPRGSGYRRLTVRECARLQSVPDAYAFEGPATWQYRHVGEGVPCLLAFHLANKMRPAFDLEKLNPPNGFLDWMGVDIPRGKVKEAEAEG